jgi:VanZ family protein
VNRRAALFLLLYVAVILYLSLYPWRFVPNASPRILDWVPFVSRRTILDAVLNLVFYMPLGAAAFLSLRRGAVAFIAAVAFGIVVSFTVEWLQLSIPTRFGNLTDLLSNSVGTLLGVAAALVATSPPLASGRRVLHSSRALLVGLWTIWQAFMFFLPRGRSSIDIGHEIAGLLVLALLATPRRVPAAVFLLLAWLAIDELRPFQFQGPPQQFGWLPFVAWFEGAPEAFYGTIFGKLFLYTAILWAERRVGIRWMWALAVPGAILFAGELAQRYLPGRTPETTDLVLLAGGAVLLSLTESSEALG